MSNRIGVHYSSYAASEGKKCIPLCEESPTHWEFFEFRGDKHCSCVLRCETHRKDDDPGITTAPVTH
jgi:hypothetical protein